MLHCACTVHAVLLCSGKHGGLAGKNLVREQKIDAKLPLSGPNSIVGRSIVIHDSKGGRWVCADIKKNAGAHGKHAYAWFDMGGVTGSIKFEQLLPGAPTVIRVNLNGLNGLANNFHVHEREVNYREKDGVCSGASTGGHFNPTKVDYSKSICNPNLPDTCEVGDIRCDCVGSLMCGCDRLLSRVVCMCAVASSAGLRGEP